MISKKRKGLDLRRGIAIFLLLAMGWCTVNVATTCEAFADETMKVDFVRGDKVVYENYHTYLYSAIYDGRKLTAYCMEPKKTGLETGEYNVSGYDAALVRKVLYYSYGYPGFEKKTAGYLENVEREECYKGDNGCYALCHLLLAYAYDNKSSKTDAFKGLKSGSRDMIKSVMSEIERWEDPPESGEFRLSDDRVKASYNKEKDVQETPEITLDADPDNSMTVELPNRTKLIKTTSTGKTEEFDSEDTESITIAGGESFKFTASKDMDDSYTSPDMEEENGGFKPFMIKQSKKQATVFGVSEKRKVSFEIEWEPVALEANPSERSTDATTIEPTTEASSETTTAKSVETTTAAPVAATSETPSKPSVTPVNATDTVAATYDTDYDSPMTGDETHLVLAFLGIIGAMLTTGCCIAFGKGV